MAFGSFQGTDKNQAMSEINMVPLIDIVLVLLVLFILAAPMAAQSVKISLPTTAAVPQKKDTEALDIQLRADGLVIHPSGDVFKISDLPSLERRDAEKDPVVRIWSDQNVRYEHLATLIVDLKLKGHRQISLMTRTN
jgi:biopolymer transport protein ExbD